MKGWVKKVIRLENVNESDRRRSHHINTPTPTLTGDEMLRVRALLGSAPWRVLPRSRTSRHFWKKKS